MSLLELDALLLFRLVYAECVHLPSVRSMCWCWHLRTRNDRLVKRDPVRRAGNASDVFALFGYGEKTLTDVEGVTLAGVNACVRTHRTVRFDRERV